MVRDAYFNGLLSTREAMQSRIDAILQIYSPLFIESMRIMEQIELNTQIIETNSLIYLNAVAERDRLLEGFNAAGTNSRDVSVRRAAIQTQKAIQAANVELQQMLRENQRRLNRDNALNKRLERVERERDKWSDLHDRWRRALDDIDVLIERYREGDF